MGWTKKDVEKLKGKLPIGTARGKIDKKGKITSISANALTKHALRILDLKGFHVWRQNNAGVYDPGKKVFRANSATPGISDIIGFHRQTGQFIACEIKAGKDRLSPEQTIFLERVKRCGGISMVVRSIDDLEAFYNIG